MGRCTRRDFRDVRVCEQSGVGGGAFIRYVSVMRYLSGSMTGCVATEVCVMGAGCFWERNLSKTTGIRLGMCGTSSRLIET